MAVAARLADALLDIMPDQPRLAKLLDLAPNDPALTARLMSVLELPDAPSQTRALLKILADTTSLTDPAPAIARMTGSAKPTRPRGDEQIIRDAVGEEVAIPPDLPYPAVLGLHRALSEVDDGAALVSRLEASAPRPVYSMDLPPSRSVRTRGQTHAVNAPVGTPDGVDNSMRRAYTSQMPDAAPGAQAMEPPAAWRNDPDAPGYQPAAEVPDPQLEAIAADYNARRPRQASAGFHARNAGAGARDMLERARQRASDVIRGSAIPATAAVLGTAAWQLLQDGANRMPEAESATDDYTPVPDITSRPEAYSAPRPQVPNVTRPPRAFSTADLAAETAPPPMVAVQDEPITLDYAQMARDKIRQANEIQLREGRITPESAALSREADALYLKAAEARREGFHPPIMPVEQQNMETSAIRARRAG